MTEHEAIDLAHGLGWYFDDLNTEWVGPIGERVRPEELRPVMERKKLRHEKEDAGK